MPSLKELIRSSLLFTSRAMLVVVVVGATAATHANAQSAATDSSVDRPMRIVENLKYSIPQLREAEIMVTSLRTGEGAFDEGTLLIGGQQQLQFVVTKNDESLFLLAAPVVDVSRSIDELNALRAADRASEAEAARNRHARLMELGGDLPFRGNPDADVVIFEFSDFECPFCARAATTVEELLEKRGDEIKLVYLHYPLSIHPWAREAATSAVCAAEQDPSAFWTLHDYYFENQNAIEVENIGDRSRGALAAAGIDLDAWSSCVQVDAATSGSAASIVQEHEQTALSFGLSGTPAFFVNGLYINGAKPLAEFEAAIDQALSEL